MRYRVELLLVSGVPSCVIVVISGGCGVSMDGKTKSSDVYEVIKICSLCDCACYLMILGMIDRK